MDVHEVHEYLNRPSNGGITGGNPDTGGNDPDPDPDPSPDPNPDDDNPDGSGQGGDGGDDGDDGDGGNTGGGGTGDGNDGDNGDDSSGSSSAEPVSLNTNPSAYSADDLDAMTVSAIKALAAELGYSLTATKKADIIEEFLAQQG